VRRRDFIKALSGAAVMAPRPARAQQPAMPVVGFLSSASPEALAPYVDAFLLGLEEAGFVKGRNCAIADRWARGRYDQLPSLAAELVERKVAVIAASGEPAVMAAKAATSTTPIIFLIGGDPVRLGLVSGFFRPGGDASGVTILTLALDLQRLALLREALPRAASIAVLMNPNFPGSDARMRDLQEAARNVVRDLSIMPAGNEGEIDQAFSKLDRRRPDALLVAGDPLFNARRDQIVALAARHAVPAIYERRDFAEAGGLMSYGTHLSDLYRRQGAYTGLVLKGSDPADLPVLQPTRFELVINLKTARTLALTVPPTLLATAEAVIE
jgi:putative tryptophan/tyrosine transport system substrate-binding protein